MGFMAELYGKQSEDFVLGFLAGWEYAWDESKRGDSFDWRETLKEAVDDLSENPDFPNIQRALNRVLGV